MSWKKRARLIKADESTPEWKKNIVRSEEIRQENLRKGEEVRGDIASRAKEFFTPPPAEDIAITAAQGATAGFADEIAGGIASAYKKATGDKRDIGEIYEETRDIIRGKTHIARTRSPLTTFISENIGAAINPLTRAGGAIKTMAQSAAIGAGETEATGIQDIAVDTAVSTGAGGLFYAGSGLLKKPFEKPQSIRARYTGVKPKAFEKRQRLGDPRITAEELNNAKFFKYKNSEFDISSGQFKPIGKKGRGLPTREESLANAEGGIQKIGEEVDKLIKLNSKKEKYLGKDLAEYQPIIEDLDDLVLRSTDEKKTSKLIEKELEKLQYSIDDPYQYTGIEGEAILEARGVPLNRINQIKQNYQREAAELFKSPDKSKKAAELAKIKKTIATGLKGFIEENSGAAKDRVKRLNDMSHHLHNAVEGLSPATATAEARGTELIPVNPYAGIMVQALQGASKIIGGGERGMLARAAMGESAEKIYQKIPEYIKKPVETAVRSEPARLFSDISAQPDFDFESVPELIVRTPLPRNSTELVGKRGFVLAKIAQQAPELFDQVNDLIKHDPEALPEVLPAIIKAAPQLFVRDKYDRVDGVIMDPAMREKAATDTMRRDDLPYLDKTLIINELNKTGRFDDH